MRTMAFCVLTAVLCCGVDCVSGPFGQTNPPDTVVSENPGDQPPAGDQTDGTQPDTTPAGCHSGTFMCANGPDWSACGSWSFEVTEMDTIVGSGTITLPGQLTPILLTLAGATDPTADAQEITLTTNSQGGGSMHAGNVGPTLEVTGDWSFSTGPEATGDETVGEITGTSCRSLQ